MTRASQLEPTLRRLAAQETLFARRVSRLSLKEVDLVNGARRKININVWRNHGFEPLIPLLQPYAAYGDWHADFRLSAYDDALLFAEREEADADLLWLDRSRFLAGENAIDWPEWLAGRLHALRASTTSPIILATWGETAAEVESLKEMTNRLPGVHFADMEAVCTAAGVSLLSLRSASLAGTPVGGAAQVVLARELACHWVPATLFQPVKAVALDLDETLHSGILGEDGIDGVRLTPAHTEFQRYIKLLHSRGVLIALLSRNARKDVEDLFTARGDYPLRWEDFSAVEISWGDKSAALERIAQALRIAPDAVLFVDDNSGELAEVALRLPGVHCVIAHPDAELTRRAVDYYPGLWRWRTAAEDAKRHQDLKANAERLALASAVADPAEYFRSLQPALTFRLDPREQLARLAELCNKTNQFNLTLRRFNESELAERMTSGETCVASVALADRLSDSGVIAVIVARRQHTQLVVEELCLSCRAMGRQLEDTIVLVALRHMPLFHGCKEIAFRVERGPRNEPALQWLNGLLDRGDANLPKSALLPAQRLLDFVPAECVTLVMG